MHQFPSGLIDIPPLADCCRLSRRARIPVLLGSRAEGTPLTPMLYDLIRKHAPSRIYEINQTLFGAMVAETPFWGVYESFPCSNPDCERELHILLIDAQMIEVIDQLVRQLYNLIDGASNDLTFRSAKDEERSRARKILSGLVFRTGNAPVISHLPPSNQLPHFWLAEALCVGFAFMVVHETSHQGPQTLGTEFVSTSIPAALRGAAQIGVTLKQEQALAWAKELAADLNAFCIMVTDAQQSGLREERENDWYRAFIMGIALVLKAWDLIIEEKCYGEPQYHRRLLRTHPPARWRINHIAGNAEQLQRLGMFNGNTGWADRVLDALDDLHR